jgi:hypothetical protein
MTESNDNDAIQYACAHCGWTNRILRSRLLDNPIRDCVNRAPLCRDLVLDGHDLSLATQLGVV